MSFFKVDNLPLTDGDFIDPSVIGDTRPPVCVVGLRDGLPETLDCTVVRILLQADPSGEQWWCTASAVSNEVVDEVGHAVVGAVASAVDPATALGAMLRKIETGKGWKHDEYSTKWASDRFGFNPWTLTKSRKRKSNK